jgi:hypothetical protein
VLHCASSSCSVHIGIMHWYRSPCVLSSTNMSNGKGMSDHLDIFLMLLF